MRDGDMCLGVSGQTPPQRPHSPLGEQGQVERPVGIKGGRAGANPVSGDPRLRTATSARSRGTPFLIWHAAKPRPEPKRMDHLVLLLPSLWLRFPPVPCLQELRSHRRTGGHLQTLRSTQQRGAEPPQGAAPAAWACWSNEQHPEKKTQSRGGAGENKAQVGEERAGKGAS